MAKKKNKAPVIVISVLIVLLLIVGGAYFGIGYYFQTHFYPNTTINGFGASLSTAEEVTDQIREEAEDYILAVHDRDERVTYINASDIDYKYVDNGDVTKALEDQEPMLWIKHIGDTHEYEFEVETSYDEQKLLTVVEGMDCFKAENIVEPQDAYLEIQDGEYVIVPEVIGSKPMEEQVLADVTQAIESRQSVLTLSDDDYAMPTILSTDTSLTEKMEIVEKYKNMTITYDVEGKTDVLDGETIASWITIGDDLSVTVDRDKAANYAQQMAYRYNTYAATRSFVTTQGDTIEIGGGDYGWVIDKSGETDQLVEDIEAGESVEREPVWEQEAFVDDSADDIGNTYVEIDYTNQHFYYYVDGKLQLDSDIVSGNLNNGNGSPDGVFKIITKKSPATLVGEDYSSDVTYFMPFAYNVGLHDASWRSSFGGSIYKGSGSHGCVNLPADTAEALYNAIEIGTPVVAYYRESVSLTSNNAKVSNAYSYTSD